MAGEETKEEDTGAKLEKEEEAKKEEEPTAEEEAAKKDDDEKDEKKKEEEFDPKVIDAVAERLNFFFSNANVRQDKFVRKFLMSDRGEYPRQVPVEALLRFNTIKAHTTNPKAVVYAAKNDERLSKKLVVSKDDMAIGLVDPFTSAKMDGHVPLTLHVSNVPLAEGKDDSYAVSSQQVRDLFEQYGPIAIVKLQFHMVDDDGEDGEKKDGEADGDNNDNKKRRHSGDRYGYNNKRRRVASGSALVEFESAESMEKAAADVVATSAKKESKESAEKEGGEGKEKEEKAVVEPKRKLKLGDNELVVTTFKDYRDSRKAEKEGGGGDNNDNRNDNRRGSGGLEDFTVDWNKGCVIRLKGLPSDCDREAILDAVAKFWDVSVAQLRERKTYVDYSRGQQDGAIRFPESEGLDNLCSKIDSGEVTIAGGKVNSAKILEGEEEEKYWKEFIEFKNRSIRHRADERRHHGGGGGGRFRHKNKRQRRG